MRSILNNNLFQSRILKLDSRKNSQKYFITKVRNFNAKIQYEGELTHIPVIIFVNYIINKDPNKKIVLDIYFILNSLRLLTC